MFSAPHRIHPSSLLDSLLIGVSLESTLQTSLERHSSSSRLSVLSPPAGRRLFAGQPHPGSLPSLRAPQAPIFSSTVFQNIKIKKKKKKTDL